MKFLFVFLFSIFIINTNVEASNIDNYNPTTKNSLGSCPTGQLGIIIGCRQS